MAFAVSSNSFKDELSSTRFHPVGRFRIGCAGGNKSPHLKWSGALGHEELRCDLL